MKPNPLLPTVQTAKDAIALVKSMSPGERFFYHFGDLARDRQTNSTLDDLASAILKMGVPNYFIDVDGYGVLGVNQGRPVQHRLDDHNYAYEFVKLQPPLNNPKD